MDATSRYEPSEPVKLKHPEWSKNAVMYQINTRQFTADGTFQAAELHLPRLKDLGADILWLMPVHEIGVKNRKGSLGSPYSVKDYHSVNREFGTIGDFKHFVNTAHALDMRVIIDWVANHTAWDCNLVSEHPEWYSRDWKGDFQPTPWCDWDDVLDLDYAHAGLRQYMTQAMKFWVRDADIDGFRCDVAGMVPTDFWNNVRKELDAIKPVFMLAEWESRDLHYEAFDMTYGWTWFDAMHAIAKGKDDVNRLYFNYGHNGKSFPRDAMSMLFVSNHDKNAWEGTEFELFGDALEPVIVLSVMNEGMPLIYNGQEAGNTRRLKFFEKDPIEWKSHEHGGLYKKLFALKKTNTALWNGKWGAKMIQAPNSAPDHVLSFVRQNNRDRVFAVFNFSKKTHVIDFTDSLHHGKYIEYFTRRSAEFTAATRLELEPWAFRVFVKP